MRKILFLIFYVSCIHVFAQQTTDSVKVDSDQSRQPREKRDTRSWKQRVGLGGSIGFWIQPRQLHLEVAPMIAYRFPKILTVGSGYRYVYNHNYLYGKNLNNYGPNFFVRASVTKRIYLWTEWEHLHTEYVYTIANQEATTKTDQADSFFAGAGYIRQLGRKGRGGISFQLLYNFLYNKETNSPYYSPVIYRIGYFF